MVRFVPRWKLWKQLKAKLRKILKEDEVPKGNDFVLTVVGPHGTSSYVIRSRVGLMLCGFSTEKGKMGVRLIQRQEAVDLNQFDKLLRYFLKDAEVRWE